MKQKLHAINFSIFCWTSALIFKLLHCILLTAIATLLTITGFIIHFLVNSDMFNNKKTEIIHTPCPHEDKGPTTIIANGVCIEGDIKLNSNEEIVHILGRLKGDIIADNGNVEILRNGNIEGDISCNSLIVNGILNGHCVCESLEIGESGEVTGTITYLHLTIKKGGIFSGHAEHSDKWPQPIVHNLPVSTEENQMND
ncbi:polymer-forming cytoskeletal protein [Escherichia coli]|uniref:bactofilin family protein n=1 Tax=Escherichia coli TaxID=562 RepID=UPI00164EE87E|nr:polymer-forming cytoskeletal protein [Escherichia coli]MBC6573191.1 hypothetical protein [Escherichia coli]